MSRRSDRKIFHKTNLHGINQHRKEQHGTKGILAEMLGIICVFVCLCSGCGGFILNQKEKNAADSTEQTTLWVLTEISATDGMNYQTEQIAKSFEEIHEEVKIKIEILPTDTEEREVYLRQLHTQIMAGGGPDVYLLPTGETVMTDVPGESAFLRAAIEYEIEPLFKDVVQTMLNGTFTDISSYYDKDEELHKEGLRKEIMDAGLVKEARYVLPLRYNMPVLFADRTEGVDSGITQNMIENGIGAIATEIIAEQNEKLAIGVQLPEDTILLSGLFDYDKGEILVTKEEIAEYMRLYQAVCALSKVSSDRFFKQCEEQFYDKIAAVEVTMVRQQVEEFFKTTFTRESLLSHLNYIKTGMHWSNLGFSLYSGTMENALEQSAISYVSGKDLVSYPLRAINGSVVAEVTYYGAVGAGSQNPELAYDFLREFLTEEYQWDILRPQTDRSKDSMINGYAQELQNDGLVEHSWPVRANGAAVDLWKNWCYQLYHNYNIEESRLLHRAFKNNKIIISLENMNILEYQIDVVCFPIVQEYEESLEYALSLLNNEDGTPTDADIDTLAEDVYRNLWWHLAEG